MTHPVGWVARSAAFVAWIAIIGFCGAAQGEEDRPEATWNALKPDIFATRPINAGEGVLSIEAPMRAEDAAVVPITVRAAFPQTPEKQIVKVTIVIDENPAPVAASFAFGPASPVASISARMRVNSYSYVRAIAELNDGSLWMTKTFVKASGGCSAPALKDEDGAAASIGQLKLLQFGADQEVSLVPAGGALTEAQIMVRHPNHSGLQMDQLTRTYIPARFVRLIELKRGGDLVFKMEGGISLSENPAIRFALRKEGPGSLSVHAEDTDGKVFEQSWPVKPTGS
jgi:sulfur-oxidizing protein SoxY